MTCRHSKGDPACSSTIGGYAWQEEQERYAREARIEALKKAAESLNQFEIKLVEEVGNLLVLQIKYPSCANCTFEGLKTLVVQATLKDAIFWRRADPHFRAGPFSRTEMPSPLARFPSTAEGLDHARAYARNQNLQ